MTEAIWSLLGVVLGFVLAESAQWLKRLKLRFRLRKSLVAELQSITRMVPSKLDVLSQAESHFKAERVMPTQSTHFPREIYSRVIIEAPEILKDWERDCLHIIHERLRVVDASMDSMEERFLSINSSYSGEQAISAAVGSINDLKEALSQTSELAQSVISGARIDVYALGNQS
ncbi:MULTISPECIES: hypothetical protein [Halomonadaceae]|jgi:hypothetical protein|uniref:hypothetical protein n=1 Tax=Halomonadaceae TaxID=28256 RepID=UPI000C320987|nr:hypothetical protein [Halomonas sp. MES3-P3E]PKG54945.1 hypothetical protein CXF87_00215 [Halomonas sp. MES3-P3E]|tara:strand:+ start:943 stop:1461 length:519 start_codon:yes stop_codon:yes gene_type:complete